VEADEMAKGQIFPTGVKDLTERGHHIQAVLDGMEKDHPILQDPEDHHMADIGPLNSGVPVGRIDRFYYIFI
jgi:hypothetical protein